ncbi:hypothetical protein [Candidatus Filomicrobium marinum]|nr:hypothetical protein [Candidatus Filomicrobium marinum]
MMFRQSISIKCEYERILGESLAEVASELRLVEVSDFIAYIRNGHMGNLESIVDSSTELFFRRGTIRLGSTSDVVLDWGVPPIVKLGMEFHNHDVSVYFHMILEADKAGLGIDYMNVYDKGGSSIYEEVEDKLRSALAFAKLQPVAHRSIFN